MGTSNSGISTSFHTFDRGPFHAVPGLAMKPASFSLSRKPMRSKTMLVAGMSDSPT
jgi:hypothetical protein